MGGTVPPTPESGGYAYLMLLSVIVSITIFITYMFTDFDMIVRRMSFRYLFSTPATELHGANSSTNQTLVELFRYQVSYAYAAAPMSSLLPDDHNRCIYHHHHHHHHFTHCCTGHYHSYALARWPPLPASNSHDWCKQNAQLRKRNSASAA